MSKVKVSGRSHIERASSSEKLTNGPSVDLKQDKIGEGIDLGLRTVILRWSRHWKTMIVALPSVKVGGSVV